MNAVVTRCRLRRPDRARWPHGILTSTLTIQSPAMISMIDTRGSCRALATYSGLLVSPPRLRCKSTMRTIMAVDPKGTVASANRGAHRGADIMPV
jgi:hypothetical protein